MAIWEFSEVKRMKTKNISTVISRSEINFKMLTATLRNVPVILTFQKHWEDLGVVKILP